MRTVKKTSVSVNAGTAYSNPVQISTSADNIEATVKRTAGAAAVDVALEGTHSSKPTDNDWVELVTATGLNTNKAQTIGDRRATFRSYRLRATSTGEASVEMHIVGTEG